VNTNWSSFSKVSTEILMEAGNHVAAFADALGLTLSITVNENVTGPYKQGDAYLVTLTLHGEDGPLPEWTILFYDYTPGFNEPRVPGVDGIQTIYVHELMKLLKNSLSVVAAKKGISMSTSTPVQRGMW